jgi:hypothetical protein
MPGVGKTAQAVHPTRCLEDSSHASIMAIVPCLGKTPPAGALRVRWQEGTELLLVLADDPGVGLFDSMRLL